jgi:phage terminase small subunit
MPTDPLDILWDNIQIAYAAIVRAQQISYVRDRDDVTTTRIGQGYSDSGSSEKWEVQQAWDKQANFMKAQARAQAELRSMIKQYEELLHANWELATEEQRARIALLKAKAETNDTDSAEPNGFIEALEKAGDVWEE